MTKIQKNDKLQRRDVPHTALLTLLLTLLVSTACQAQSIGGEGGQSKLSPGPSGALLERDYRVSVTWLESAGDYRAGDYARWLSFGGHHRYYEVHVPPQYAPGMRVPVVLVLHGGGGNPDVVRYESHMDEVADEHGFITVYPSGTGVKGDDRILYWNSGPRRNDAALRDVDDVGFISAVLDDVTRFFSVDNSRVYSTGISNGAQMSFRLAAELSNRIAAVGPVSGERAIGQFFDAPPRPVPVIAFHGVKDTFLPFNGGKTPSSSAFQEVALPPAADMIAGWVVQAGGNPNLVEKSQTGHATRYHYPPTSPQGTEVDFVVLDDGGHTWPGGRKTKIESLLGVGEIDQDISASEIMWDFFQRHSLGR